MFEKGGIVSRGNSYLSSETPVSCFLLGTVLYPPHAPVTRTNEHHYDYQSQQQCDLSSRHVNSQALQVSIITLPYHYPPPLSTTYTSPTAQRPSGVSLPTYCVQVAVHAQFSLPTISNILCISAAVGTHTGTMYLGK